MAALILMTPGRADEPAPVAGTDWPALREETFGVVWDTVNTSYFDPHFGGVDWAAVREKYHLLLPAAADNAALRTLLERMLGELRRTHFAILPRQMAVFAPSERVRMGTAGVEIVYSEQRVVVGTVGPASAGERAGLHAGDEVVAVDGIDVALLGEYLNKIEVPASRRALYLTGLVEQRLRGPVDSFVKLRLQDLTGTVRLAEVKLANHEGVWSEPTGNFPSEPVECSSRVGPDGIGCLRFNIFTREIMKEYRSLLHNLPAGGGLVLDLRGNPGGLSVMASGMSGWLSDHEYLLATMHLREGQIGFFVTPQAKAFVGPLAILVDSRSCSTSEIMAAGLQEAGRARIFGEATPGAALPSQFKTLPTGDLFQYAIADIQTPRGALIEGHGVVPDEMVACTRGDLAAGRDPVADAARRWIQIEREKTVAPPATPAQP